MSRLSVFNVAFNAVFNPVLKPTRVCLLLLLAHFHANNASAAPYSAGWYGEIQTFVRYQDNVARSYRPIDNSEDTVASILVGAGYFDKISDNLQYTLAGYVAYNYHDRFAKLRNTAISFNGSAVWQPDATFDALWYEGMVEVTRLEYSNNEAREGYLFVGDISVNKRLMMNTVGRVGYRYSDFVFDKSENEVNRDAAFDVANHEAFIGFDHALTHRLYLVGEYSYRHGGFTASVSGTPDPTYMYEAQTEDVAFKTCDASGCDNWYAYRSVVDVHAIDIGLSWGRGETSYDLSARYYYAEGDGPSYDDWTVQVGAIWNF